MTNQFDSHHIDFYSSKNHTCLNEKNKSEYIQSILERIPDNQSLILVPTSGTTGTPKVVAIKKASFLNGAKAVNDFLAVTKDDIWINPLPLFHVGGLSIYARASLLSNTVIPFLEWNASLFHKSIESSKATLTSLVPTQIFDLIQAELHAPPSLRAVLVGGGKLDRCLAHDALELGWPLILSFGMSETSALIAARKLSKSDIIKNKLYQMELLSHVEARLSDNLLEVKSNALFEGYYSFLNTTLTFLDPKIDGWFQTEDKALLQEKTLTALGRITDSVKIRGELIEIDAVESLIKENLAASSAAHIALFAAPDLRTENKLILACERILTVEEVASIKNSLPRFAPIEDTFHITKIPRSSLGKVLKNELKDIYMTLHHSKNTQAKDSIITSISQRGALEVIEIQKGENTFRFTPFGGQLIAWEKNQVPILFENEISAITDGKTAYRGGAPVCAPYFGKGLLLPEKFPVEPQHGNARKSVWDYEINNTLQTVTCSTVQPSAAGYPETTFKISICYSFNKNDCDIEMIVQIENLGNNTSPAQCVIHSYWQTTDPKNTSVEGLGTKYFDNLNNLSFEEYETTVPTQFTPPYDRVYPEPDRNICVTTDAYSLTITTEGTNSAVLWNPGEQHGLKDLAHALFVCVESGVVTPAAELQPNEKINFSINWKVALQ